MTDATPRALQGVFAAALTPLDADLNADHAALLAHYRWLLNNGCDGIAVLGTTGEANSFSVDERLALLDAVAESDIDSGKLLIGTGCCAIPDTVRLTRRALEMGAAGALVLPPFYYKGVGEDGLFAAFARIIEQVGDPLLRIYIYHFPRMTGVDISVSLLERLVAAYPQTVVGLKDSSGDWSNTEAVCQALPGFGVFAGSEQFLLPTLRAGGAGCISASANVTCALVAELYRHWREAEADALQEHVTQVRRAIEAYPMIPALKWLLAGWQGRPGWLELRPPLTNLEGTRAVELAAALEAVGFTLPSAA
jgi:4-hydroxy-tetrahydrodipicolinate synthase